MKRRVHGEDEKDVKIGKLRAIYVGGRTGEVENKNRKRNVIAKFRRWDDRCKGHRLFKGKSTGGKWGGKERKKLKEWGGVEKGDISLLRRTLVR